jgi:WD40-like Beta Propeller Repeat
VRARRVIHPRLLPDRPSSTADGLILYFHRQSGGTVGVFAAGRVDAQSTFTAGAAVTVDGTSLVNTILPTISADGQTLYFVDLTDTRVYAATRGASPTAFTGRRAASSVMIGSQPILSADELTMYYAQVNGVDVLVSTRASKTQQFGTGIPLGDGSSPAADQPVALSHDGCVLYISSARSGGLGGRDIWQAIRPR